MHKVCLCVFVAVHIAEVLFLYLQGPSKAPLTATPNQFAPVASLFFFPLMERFDSAVNTLDLLGQDSLVLGNLLYTLGTIMHCATHAPVATAMAKALMNFIWTFRYHPSTYVHRLLLCPRNIVDELKCDCLFAAMCVKEHCMLWVWQ